MTIFNSAPICKAISNKNVEMVKLLLSRKDINVNATSEKI